VLRILALSFYFLNGFHDRANRTATVIASRTLSSRSARALVAAELAGPFLFGAAVAKVILAAAILGGRWAARSGSPIYAGR
jgi:phosphate/sulfate permease